MLSTCCVVLGHHRHLGVHHVLVLGGAPPSSRHVLLSPEGTCSRALLPLLLPADFSRATPAVIFNSMTGSLPGSLLDSHALHATQEM